MKFTGLTENEVKENGKLGKNCFKKIKRKSFRFFLSESLKDKMTIILFAVAIIEFGLYILTKFYPALGFNDWISAVTLICFVVLLCVVQSIISYKQNLQFEDKVVDKSEKNKARVIREGKETIIYWENVCIGDYIVVGPGEQIPADGIIVDGCITLDTENVNSHKGDVKKFPFKEDGISIPTEQNIVLRGSKVVEGNSVFVVTEVGDNTYIGKLRISHELLGTKESFAQEKMNLLAKKIMKFCYIGAFLVAVVNIVIGITDISVIDFPTLCNIIIISCITGISIVIMAVPEGLVFLNMLCKNGFVKKLRKSGIVVRNANTIEGAGSVTRLLINKTGLLTQKSARVNKVFLGNGKTYTSLSNMSSAIKQELKMGAFLNNDARITEDGEVIGSNFVDRAIIKYFIDEFEPNYSKIKSYERFDPEKKYSMIEVEKGVKYYKGAPDLLFTWCNYFIDKNGCVKKYTEGYKRKLIGVWKKETYKGLNQVLIVKKDGHKFICVAMIEVEAQIRKNAITAVKRILKSGINVTLVTGDALPTAKSVAKKVGIFNGYINEVYLEHDSFVKMSDDEVIEILPSLKILARADSEDRLRLVKLYKQLNEVVGITGDNPGVVNAMGLADVSFSLGSGSNVTKESSDMILERDSLLAIAVVMAYGRTISRNIRKFLTFQLTVNIATIFLSIFAPICGFTEIFSILQVLWINLIMDMLAAFSFANEAVKEKYLDEPLSNLKKNVLDSKSKSQIAFGVIYIVIVCTIILMNISNIAIIIGCTTGIELRTFMFSVFIITIVFNGFNVRADGINLLEDMQQNKIFLWIMISIIVVQVLLVQFCCVIFGTSPLSINSWVVIFIVSGMIVPLNIVRKVIKKR